MTTLIEQVITKMGLNDEPNVLEKTTELMRLLELRATNVPLQVNEYGKIVLCSDIASTLLNIGFDKEQALKLSGLRKSHYVNNKRMFEKLLDLSKLPSVNDICIQLSLNELTRKAEDLLAVFKGVMGESLDADHPQYAAMAVFHAARLMKKKVTKTKLMPYSNLRPTQWQQLEQQWERMIEKHYKETNVALRLDDNLENQQDTNVMSEKKNKSKKNDIEEYEQWKSRMLNLAEAKLKELEGKEKLKSESS